MKSGTRKIYLEFTKCNVNIDDDDLFSVSLCVVFVFQLARATVRDPKTGVLTTANYRVSKR